MNRINILLSTLLVAIIIGGFTSCNVSENPIFYTLEQERPIVDDSLDNEITVHNVVKGGIWYFAAAPKIFYRNTPDGSTWETANMPQSGVMCEAMDIFGGNLYAGFFSIDGQTFRLYSAPPGSILIWSPVGYGPGSAINDEQIVMLKDVDGTNLLIGTKNGDTYSLHGTGATYLTSLDGIITDALYDSDNTLFWVVAGSEIYQAATLAGLGTPLATAPSLSSGVSFGGIHYSAALVHDYYLSTTDGKIWYSNDAGGTWTSSASVSDVSFTRFIEAGGNLLVGTRSHGYYKLTGGDVTQMERRPDYNISDLRNGGVLNFALLDGKLFACTAGAGLWRSIDSGGEWHRE